MNTGNYSITAILEHAGLEQLIIPEIQRDYVWKTSDVKDFLKYIDQGFRGGESDKPYLGFIYAYNDREFPYKYILVDGQQRMTTIYLILLACYHKIGKGLPEYLFNRHHLKLEYKVRQATHDFLLSLVNFCKNNPGLNFRIEDQIWHHNEYSYDRTIVNLISNFNFICEWLDGSKNDLVKFANFIEENVKLSYFDIEESRQGEDLYIYMNSRGKQLEPNETLKAKYLSTTSEKKRWGTEWEVWQDFFWKHKGNRPDADAGFNDFLRMVQVLSMSEKNIASDQISIFVSGKGDPDPSFEMLPATIEKLAAIYDAYKWFVKADSIVSMYRSLNEPDNYLTTIPRVDRRQVYYLRILPVISFLYISGCRDEIVALRFARYFYNIARKESVGKDISTQLPAAIKLMLEYGTGSPIKFDVCDLIDYSKGRKILIDEEEVIKLTIFRKFENLRPEIEKLFWSAEDHVIFDGEVSFLLNEYYDALTISFDIEGFRNSWEVFQVLFNGNSHQHKIALALLYYGNTWTQKSPLYYSNYDCMAWKELVKADKGIHLIELIKDLHSVNSNIDSIITTKMHEHFSVNSLDSVDKLKLENRLFQQIQIIAAIDFYTDKNLFKFPNGYIAKDPRYNYGDTAFFLNGSVLFNISRYVGDGSQGRLMKEMSSILQDDNKIQEIINVILSKKL